MGKRGKDDNEIQGPAGSGDDGPGKKGERLQGTIIIAYRQATGEAWGHVQWRRVAGHREGVAELGE